MLRMNQTVEAKPTIRVALTPLPPLRRVALRPLPSKQSVVATLKAEIAQLKAENTELKAENVRFETRNAYLMELIAQNTATMACLNGEIGVLMDFLSNPRLRWHAVHYFEN